MQLGVAVAVPIDGDDAISIFCNNIAIGVHAEGAHHIIIGLGTIENLRLINLVGDMLKHICRHLHSHTNIHLIIDKGKAQLATFFGIPFGPGTTWRSNEVCALYSAAIGQGQLKAAIILLLNGLHRRVAANFHLLLQEFIDVFHNHQVIFRA